ncbi:glycosyltransferase family 2 protein [Knoellia locipacati]|uniref:Succinoglycan biosynthesis protein exoa n=1 Tax=Knoellia locipacati TaxID=882824 RepID=A0A512SWJ4_9MICO|nr:glycosyltransferase family 2 protein [Knoellia locipacati]GEQ12319.1 succinoglycan biosynthesis protein exoa [Knoellia locipacati]
MSEPADPDDSTAALPPVSVVIPVLNEERHLRDAVGQVLRQSYAGDLEVVLALGPSTDRTDEVAAELASADPRVRTVPNPSGRTPAALNAGIGASRHDVVVRVDGHAEIPEDYVATAVRTLDETGADNVGGLMKAVGRSAFERAVACAMRSRIGVGGGTFHVGGGAGPVDTVYLGAFRRSALERVGGYDERYTRTQDWHLNLRLRQTGGTVWFTPDMEVTYRPRSSVRALARQYFQYGQWRRVVAREHPETMNARYLAPPVMVAGTTAATLLGLVWAPALLVPTAYVVGVVVGGAAISAGEPARTRALAPVVLATMHWAWGVGFLTSPRSLGRETP